LASKSGSLGSASKQTAFDSGFCVDIDAQHKCAQICSNRIHNRGESALTVLESFVKMQANQESLTANP